MKIEKKGLTPEEMRAKIRGCLEGISREEFKAYADFLVNCGRSWPDWRHDEPEKVERRETLWTN